MKFINYCWFWFLPVVFAGCITQFVPETDESQELLVVEGVITDQQEVNTIRLSRSSPLGKREAATPVTGSTVILSDDQGNSWTLHETLSGIYQTDPSLFRGVTGRKYKLNIHNAYHGAQNYSYETYFVEMKPVPPIDTLFYRKVTIKEKEASHPTEEGCQIYLDTHDQDGACMYYRWDYSETWEFHLGYAWPVNNTCWITLPADKINIKNTSVLSENRIDHYPLKFISNESDRLQVKYSLLVNQYSMNEEEFDYWDKLQNITENVGSLYDIIPASIPSNIYCIENPAEKVLGYFSVSGKTSKRIFVDENFAGQVDLYSQCIGDTLWGTNLQIPGLDIYTWVLEESNPFIPKPYTIVTYMRSCADCTTRGSLTKPDFWDNDK
jgi:hypothetical protein